MTTRRRFLQTTAAAATGVMLPKAATSEPPTRPLTPPTAEECFAIREQGGRIPVIFDTDIGDDIDDTWALLYLLKCPELDVQLISCERPRGRYRARIVAKLLEAVGRTDVPIALGRNGEGTGRQGGWADDYDLEAYSGTLIEDGAQAVVDTINASEQPVTVIGIGPVPLLADAVRLDPFIARKARFVGMHGSITVGYGGSETPVPEYNVKEDPAALRTVLEADWEATITPLDTCGLVALDGDAYQRVRNSTSPGIAELMATYDGWLPRAKWVESIDSATASTVLFDLVAVTLAFDERWFQMETLPLVVTDEGRTDINRQDGRPVRTALKWRDQSSYEQHIVDRLTGPIASPAG